jgi:hypothetical protein
MEFWRLVFALKENNMDAHHSQPTLTIIANALRVADHIGKRVS